jgi:ABC-2 type transport system permease protein
MNAAHVKAIVLKEWKESFNSPMPYIFMVAFFLITGWFYFVSLFLGGQATPDEFFAPMPIMLVFFLPAFSMRLFAEEYKTGTVEPLSTMPVRDTDIVIGKYLSVLAMWASVLALSFFYVIVLFVIGKPDIGQVLASYIGLFLLGGLYGAAGLFASSLTRSQVVAFVLGFIFCFAFFLFGKAAQLLGGATGDILVFLGVDIHYGGFLLGVVDTRDVIYFLSAQILFLAATLVSFNSRRWR